MSEELYNACKDNDKAKVLQLLQSQAIVDVINDGISHGQYTALWNASRCASVDIVEALIAKGADVNVMLSAYGEELPIHAACGSDIDAAKKCEVLLGDTNRNMNKPSDRAHMFRLPISIAAEHGNIHAVDLLLRDCGADYDIRGLDRGGGPLQAAAAEGHSKVIDLLLEHDPSIINTQSQYNEDEVVGTALHAAASNGRLEAVKALIAHAHCDVKVKDSAGRTALEAAEEEVEDCEHEDEQGFRDVIELLSNLS